MTSIDGVYAHADGRTYVACDADGTWWRWPAVAAGWSEKRRATADDADPEREYDAFHAQLALRLSGAPCDDQG